MRTGDIITEVDGRRVALSPAERNELFRTAAAAESEGGPGGLSLEDLKASAAGREVEARCTGAVHGLFKQLDPEESGRAGAKACCVALAGKLAQALFGPYKSRAGLSLWRRDGGGGEYKAVPGRAECLRTGTRGGAGSRRRRHPSGAAACGRGVWIFQCA